MLKDFKFYLEMVEINKDIVLSKISEINSFKQGIKKEDINSENFTFSYFPERDFNPVIYTNTEGTTNFYVSTLDDLAEKIKSEKLFANNNTLSYTIEYMEDGAIIKKSFGTEEYGGEREEGMEHEKKIVSSSETKKIDKFGEKYEKLFTSMATSELKY
jgi:hypothetical protein